ncbi:MAG: UDP-N-acetylglucosamine diphosphorylase/glucosamine-1-phosphate N-acetyltransferase [Acidobacteria bacterium]|nr:UDP-N-acetylglucosamine diphosphorylase/glucosamine-1-phosphate N-acetyltransferase [Acidobacteriota bacterium]
MNRKAVVLFLGGRGEAAFRPVLGRPLGAYALEAAAAVGPEAVLILAGAAAQEDWRRIAEAVVPKAPVFLLDVPAARPGRRGALEALLRARPVLESYPDRDILVVPSARPLVRPATLKALLRAHAAKRASLTFLAAPGGAGLSDILVLRSADVFPLLKGLAAGPGGFPELALRLTRAGRAVAHSEGRDALELLAAGDAPSAARAAELLRGRKNEALARRGVVLLDPATAWIDWAVEIGPRTVIHPSVVIEGESRVGADARVHPFVHISGSTLGRRVTVLTATVMESTVLENDVQVGPFSRFRPKTRVRAGAKVGNFVEMKNTDFGRGSKAQHLSYLGDSTVGEDVNVGAGTITCNYDGVSKNPTRIGAGAFIGSGTELVAPVEVGRGAYVAAGSTITKDVAAGALAIARARQVEKPGWVLARVKGRKSGGGRREP